MSTVTIKCGGIFGVVLCMLYKVIEHRFDMNNNIDWFFAKCMDNDKNFVISSTRGKGVLLFFMEQEEEQAKATWQTVLEQHEFVDQGEDYASGFLMVNNEGRVIKACDVLGSLLE